MAFPCVSQARSHTQLFSLFSGTKQSQEGQSWEGASRNIRRGWTEVSRDPGSLQSSAWPLEASLPPSPENSTSWGFPGLTPCLGSWVFIFISQMLIKIKLTLLFTLGDRSLDG